MKGSPAQPATAAMQLALLPSQPACNCLSRNTGPDLSCKQDWKAGSRHASIPCSCKLPEFAALDGGKERDSKGKMEECLPGISRRKKTEADFDANSGRERDRKQDQADRKVAGVLGAFCKHHLSVSALNLIISTRATD